MIRLNDIALPLDYDESALKKETAKKLKTSPENIEYISLYRRSVDARKKGQLHFLASADVKLRQGEKRALSACRSASLINEYKYIIPQSRRLEKRPVIIGSGPCGTFAALILARAGQSPIIIERGQDVDRRTADVESFNRTGILDTSSNIQFGEGGAGTFSDGKLNTGTKDSRIRQVLLEFNAHGAPDEILYLAKPHIGTDILCTVVRNIRKTVISLGGEYRFGARLTDIAVKDGRVAGAVLEQNGGKYTIDTDNIILAIGHSARDTFELLHSKGMPMEQKPFAAGVRIEHLQENISRAQYGDIYKHPALGAADYKLAVHLPSGRGVYTFCMCPGGTVVAAASENGRLVTNGMSEFARDKTNANSALLVGINTDDFGSSDVLAGIALQRRLEESAFSLGGGGYRAPVQRVCDLMQRQASSSIGSVVPSYTRGYTLTSLDKCLPAFITDSLREGLLLMDKRLSGFADGDAVLTAVESRSSSPVRMIRDDTMQSPFAKGLYPCGEGAGYAGGITSAAVDGIKAAEMILNRTME